MVGNYVSPEDRKAAEREWKIYKAVIGVLTAPFVFAYAAWNYLRKR